MATTTTTNATLVPHLPPGPDGMGLDSFRDVGLHGLDHAAWFLRILRGARPDVLSALNARCRTITIDNSYDHPSLCPSGGERTLSHEVQDILSHIAIHRQLPRLRSVSLHLRNHTMEVVFDHLNFDDFPSQVSELKFYFFSDENVDPKDFASEKSSFGIRKGSLASVRDLKLVGTSLVIQRELLAACGGEDALDHFEYDCWVGPGDEVHEKDDEILRLFDNCESPADEDRWVQRIMENQNFTALPSPRL
ncbi:hypothetical protein VNI00_000632 [Paramarasmius palmivorus]|uniref:Uncharacterized protein n=1 Tax=Paramarasmius palmivorus TaxID=297713 RepID=A0AAW0E9T4_9AGAR